MTRFLLDINVLIALIDPAHVQHDWAHEWFRSKGQRPGPLVRSRKTGCCALSAILDIQTHRVLRPPLPSCWPHSGSCPAIRFGPTMCLCSNANT